MNGKIIHGLPNADYHGDTSAIGCSGLKAVLKSPAYYYGQYLDPRCPPEGDRETPGRFFGNLVHCALFEHPQFNARYRVGPAVASKALKAWKDFAAELPPGCQGITPAQYETAQRVRESVLAIPDMAEALASGHGEVSAYWTDEATGVRCKVRPDWVNPVGEDSVIIIDGKTFASADPHDFARQVVKMDYALQAAFYSHGYAKASGKNVLAFVFLVVADDYPHLASTMTLDEEAMSAGARRFRRALDSYAQCKKTGVWPGYSQSIQQIALPQWALQEYA
jgi:hypothetical protein